VTSGRVQIPPPDRPGATVVLVHPSVELYGADRMLLESVQGMLEAGWRAVVVLPGPGPLAERLSGTGAEVVYLPSPVLRKAFMSPAGVLRLAVASARSFPGILGVLNASGARVVYVNTLTVPLWLLAARLRRLPAVCHVHEAETTGPALVRRGLIAPLRLARAVLTNSEASRAVILAENPGLDERTHVVYNGFPGPSTVAEPRRRLTGPIRLVLVGRISPRKGTDVAVEALRLLVASGLDVTLDLVGAVFQGYEWYEQQVREQVHGADLVDRVRWRGVTPEPWSALASADIAIVPSRLEPFGNTAVEAMLALRPVVASSTQGLREIVRPGLDGEVVEPGDARSLAEGVERVIADWPRARSRALAAAERAALRFSPERYRKELAECVGAVAGVYTLPRQRSYIDITEPAAVDVTTRPSTRAVQESGAAPR
jgi:glycosyltransferase involved in cell wall biosynthesis